MASLRSSRYSARFVSLAAVAATIAVIAILLGLHRRQDAIACGWSPPVVEDLTTFDQAVAGAPTRLLYDPFTAGFGDVCIGCNPPEFATDWRGYIKGPMTADDWSKVLFDATADELDAIGQRLADPSQPAPQRFAASSIWKASGASRQRMQAALGVVTLARAISATASIESNEAAGSADRARLLRRARAGLAAAPDKFLRQRYAFLVLRILFYQRAWPDVIAFFDRNAATLRAPSTSLAFRARYYAAGALLRTDNRARANLELARIASRYPPLAGPAIRDFAPMEDRDWRASLRLARTPRERAELWRMTGLKLDGLVAIKEIFALDPKSKLLGLLAVREVARAELIASGEGPSPDRTRLAAQRKAYAALEKLVVAIAATPGADRPWLMQLVAGHLAAVRGDLATARERLGNATAARPADRRVANQAKASLALALARSWKIEPGREKELAATVAAIPNFPLLGPLLAVARRDLATAYAAAGNPVEAEFLAPGGRPLDVPFLLQMIARSKKVNTDWDRFVVGRSYTQAGLELTLARHQLAASDYAAAATTFAASAAGRDPLHTDPFVMRLVDCHDCDHEKYANAPHTFASFAARLVALRKAAQRSGEAGAQASLELGNALYNVTWYGNARVVLEPSFEGAGDTKAAELAYERAFKLSKKPETRARAAFFAAKAELGTLLTAAQAGNASAQWNPVPLPVPTRWFTKLRTLSRTRYYAEVLAECGHFRDWVRSVR